MDAPCVKCDSELEKVQPYNYLNVWARVIAIARRSCPGHAHFELKGSPHEPPGNMPSPLDSLGSKFQQRSGTNIDNEAELREMAEHKYQKWKTT